MLEAVVSRVVDIFLIICTPITIIFNIVHLSFKWKCRKKHYNEYLNPCHESNCKWSEYCEKYEHIYTATEIASLYKMIEDYQNEQKQDIKTL